MPPPHRLAAEVVAELLERWFPADRILVPSANLSRDLVSRCNDAAVEGGAVYDALIGLTAAEADTTLVTRDQRAALTYRRVDVEFRIVR